MIAVSDPNNSNRCIALLGGGGKTTLMRRLGAELSASGKKVLLTSLTKMLNDPDDNVLFTNDTGRDDIKAMMDVNNPLYLMMEIEDEAKLRGLTAESLEEIQSLADVCIFECDGARSHPIKCHSDFDPVVPEFASHVIIIVGAEIINTTVNDGVVHRPDLFMQKWKIDANFVMHPDFVADVVTSEHGYLEKIPHHQETIFYINKTDLNINAARDLAKEISARSQCHVWIGSLKSGFCEQIT